MLKFGFMSEADPRPGQTYGQRYWDLVDEVVLADKVGFDFFGTSEQHFAYGIASMSAPEVFYPYLFSLTDRIRFRHSSVLLPYKINHPLRIAERMATMDLLSHGRVEMTTARGNTLLSLRGFDVDPDETRAQWDEAVDLIQTAFTQDPFTFEGEYFKIPPRSLVPRPLQDPYPPMSVASTSHDSIINAAAKGLGVLTSSVERGWDFLEEAVAVYKKAAGEREAAGEFINNSIAVYASAHCAPTVDQAITEAGPTIANHRRLAGDAFARLSTLSPDYAYLKDIADVDDKLDDLDYLRHDSGSVIIGDPDDFIAHITRYQQMGADEVWFRLDGLPHHMLMQSIELIGRYVIPQFQDPRQIVQDPETMRNRARAKRAEIAAKQNNTDTTT